VPSSSVNIRVPSSSVNIRVPSSSVNIIFLAEQQDVKRPEVISGCPDLSEPLTRRQHNDDVTDSTAGHPGAPCSGFIRR
ncbi:hypothetical protein KUCAC02_011684, partial [Chaenocephalus aceratus]